METTNVIRSVRVGNITVNLHNVGYVECIDTVDDNDTPIKALWVYCVGGRNVQLYAGDPVICQNLHDYIDMAMGQFLDLTHLTEKKEAPAKCVDSSTAGVRSVKR